MKKINLSQGKFALVSDEDFERVKAFKWYASLESRGTKWYAIRWSKRAEHGTGKRFKIRMHRFILGLPPGEDDPRVVDHLDCDGLNNQRSNLEIVTQEENMNRVPRWRRGPDGVPAPFL